MKSMKSQPRRLALVGAASVGLMLPARMAMVEAEKVAAIYSLPVGQL